MFVLFTIWLGLHAADWSSFKVETIDGRSTTLAEYKGKPLVIVNVASRCGFTPQYAGLEALYKTYAPRGLVILGFPSNDFLHQEPGTNAEIQKFCTTKYGVTFPLFAKGPVSGADVRPLFKWLTENAPAKGEVRWNFEKFLIARDGRVTARFRSDVKPDSAEFKRAIDALVK